MTRKESTISTDTNAPDEDAVLAQATAARAQIADKAAELLNEALGVFTDPEHGFLVEDALRVIALQALEKAILYVNILPESEKAAVSQIPMIYIPVPA